jgi:hypothetical protein
MESAHFSSLRQRQCIQLCPQPREMVQRRRSQRDKKNRATHPPTETGGCDGKGLANEMKNGGKNQSRACLSKREREKRKTEGGQTEQQTQRRTTVVTEVNNGQAVFRRQWGNRFLFRKARVMLFRCGRWVVPRHLWQHHAPRRVGNPVAATPRNHDCQTHGTQSGFGCHHLPS